MTTTEQPPSTYRQKDDPRAIAWLKRYERMLAERSLWESGWQEIADYFLPRKASITSLSSAPDIGREARLFDTTGQDAVLQCAAGLLAWTSPGNQPWFKFAPIREHRRSDAVKNWTNECSELAHEYLAKSNFGTERHEDLINHCSVCTSAMFVTMQGKRTVFRSLAIGTYTIAENFLGEVDTLYREFEITARQAQQQFGKDKLGRDTPLPECIAKCLGGDSKDEDKKFTFVHVVEPRPAKDRGDGVGLQAGWQKPWTDVYICKDDKCVMSEDGFDSFPYSVGRWLKVKFGVSESVWGYGPGFTALPEDRQLNFLQKMMDVHAEKIVFPPMMVPDTLEGELDISARGVTYYEGNINPQGIIPLPVTGDYKVGLERLEMRKKAVETKFHVDFFQLFRNIDPKVTATQVIEMANERLTMISPAFSRLVSEKDTPMLNRCFEMWAQSGMLPEPPEEAIQVVGNSVYTPNPQVDFISRLALAIKAQQNGAFDRSFARIMQVAAVDPSVLDNFNWPVLVRDTMRNDGVPVDWIRPMEEIEQIQAQRAEMQKMQAMAAMAKDAGAAAGGLEKIAKPEVRELIGA